jgi:hypothetical protein
MSTLETTSPSHRGCKPPLNTRERGMPDRFEVESWTKRMTVLLSINRATLAHACTRSTDRWSTVRTPQGVPSAAGVGQTLHVHKSSMSLTLEGQKAAIKGEKK